MAIREVKPNDKSIEEVIVDEISDGLLQELVPRWRSIVTDTLYTYRELLQNCSAGDYDDGPLYDEVDSEVPVRTTQERMFEECMEKIGDSINDIIGSSIAKALSNLDESVWTEFLVRYYEIEEVKIVRP